MTKIESEDIRHPLDLAGEAEIDDLLEELHTVARRRHRHAPRDVEEHVAAEIVAARRRTPARNVSVFGVTHNTRLRKCC